MCILKPIAADTDHVTRIKYQPIGFNKTHDETQKKCKCVHDFRRRPTITYFRRVEDFDNREPLDYLRGIAYNFNLQVN